MTSYNFSELSRIALCGSEEQKQKYLPSLAQLNTIACWVSSWLLILYTVSTIGYNIFEQLKCVLLHLQALTEPAYGSDASALNTTATKVNFSTSYIYLLAKLLLCLYLYKQVVYSVSSFMLCHVLAVSFYDQVEGGWILEGQKRWIGNSTFADVLVIIARNTATNQINGYANQSLKFVLLQEAGCFYLLMIDMGILWLLHLFQALDWKLTHTQLHAQGNMLKKTVEYIKEEEYWF